MNDQESSFPVAIYVVTSMFYVMFSNYLVYDEHDVFMDAPWSLCFAQVVKMVREHRVFSICPYQLVFFAWFA